MRLFTKRQPFITWWLRVVWHAMTIRGKGYRYPKQDRDVGDRRQDKAEFKGPQWARRYRDRYQ